MTLRTRIARLTRALGPPDPVEIVVRGGLPDSGPFDRAEAGGRAWERQPEEAEAGIRARARPLAVPMGARRVVFGGLPGA